MRSISPHAAPDVTGVGAWTIAAAGTHDPGTATDEDLIALGDAAAASMPAALVDTLEGFAAAPGRSGALLIRDVPIGEVPATPATPTDRFVKDATSEAALLAVARRLGEPVGYQPEHGGRIVQQLVPTRAGAAGQLSTSSSVELMYHTETAFHPHRPRYLALLCLRGDAAAATTLGSIHELLPLLDDAHVAALREPRYRTAVDASFLGTDLDNVLGDPRPLLEGSDDSPTFVYDADLMVATDPEAQAALDAIGAAVAARHTSVVLEAGDLLVVDNDLAVHGRTVYSPRFDGTDRWLQRTFVVGDLEASRDDRHGRVIVTEFGIRRTA